MELDREDKIIKIETPDGGEYKLKTTIKPKLKDEDDDTFTLDDVGNGKNMVGFSIKLGFNSSGVVNEIALENGPNSTNGSVRVKGIATAADDGLKLEGSSKTYTWLSNKKTNLRVYGSPTESLDTVKKMIEDDKVKVYVEASLDDDNRVEKLTVYVREEGQVSLTLL